jgi:hypothetical protein
MDPFIWRVILSFIVGGSYAATLIWISERFGTKIGGILTGLPSTVFISLTFIALTSGNSVAHKSALIIPAMTGASLVLVYSFTRLLHLKPALALSSGIGIWLICAVSIVKLQIVDIVIAVLIGVVLSLATKVAMRRYPYNLKSSSIITRNTYIYRILAAGTVIAFAVIMARVAGPVWGGVFASFPATYVTTLYILRKSQGVDYAQAVARQLPVSNGSTMIFAVIFYLLILRASLLVTLIAAVCGSFAYALMLLKVTTKQ